MLMRVVALIIMLIWSKMEWPMILKNANSYERRPIKLTNRREHPSINSNRILTIMTESEPTIISRLQIITT